MRDFSDIELRLLRVFIGVVEAGGMSSAQATLNIALPTISAHLATLEERLAGWIFSPPRKFLESCRGLVE